MCQAEPALAEPLVAGLPYLKAEALFAARYEMAQTLEDVLARRTRAAMLDSAATRQAAAAAARLLAAELGWSPGRERAEVDLIAGTTPLLAS
jgi:glycerol-3-phosphate dehydrogenase